MIRSILLCFWFSFLWADSASLPFSGDYDRALIAAESDLITGHFSDCTGACKFECNFFFEGKRGARQFEITAYFPGEQDVIRGTAKADGKRLRLHLEKLPDGCWNVAPELKGEGTELLLNQKTDWLQIRILRKKSDLRDKPQGKKTIHLEKRQTVIVLKKQKDWFYVKKPGAEIAVGWIRERDLFPLRQTR